MPLWMGRSSWANPSPGHLPWAGPGPLKWECDKALPAVALLRSSRRGDPLDSSFNACFFLRSGVGRKFSARRKKKKWLVVQLQCAQNCMMGAFPAKRK